MFSKVEQRGLHWYRGRVPILGACLSLVCVLGLVAGCFPATKTGFDSPAPSKRIDAIVDASALEDDESLVKLVVKLRSFDPVERMFAIRSLEIRTGETLGYQHAAHDWERVEAIGRWVQFLEEQGISLESSAGTHDELVVEEGVDDGENNTKQPIEQDAG